MNKAAKNQVIYLSAIALSACSAPSETFDCPPGKGVGCQPISAVNRLVNQGVLGEDTPETHPGLEPPSFTEAFSASDGFSVYRVQEKHLRVWIAPFQDAQGNFHEGSVVHTVVKPGSWQIGDLPHSQKQGDAP